MKCCITINMGKGTATQNNMSKFSEHNIEQQKQDKEYNVITFISG